MSTSERLSDVRLTIRLPSDLHARLRLFALGRSNGHTPELSQIVREAIEHYLTPPACQTSQAKNGQRVRHKETPDAS